MVNQADGTAQLYVEIPPSLKYLVDEDDRTNKELVIAALEKELGVRSEDSMAVIKRRIKRLEDRLEDEKSAFDNHRDRVQDIQDELERARDLRESKVEEGEDYEQRLDTILDDLEAEETAHIFPTHGRLDDLRAEFDRPNEEIHLDLQQRAAEQNRDLSVARFKQRARADDADWMTPITDHWGNDE